MSASQNEFTYTPISYHNIALSGWYIRKLTGPYLSLDDIRDICNLALYLAEYVIRVLPCVDEKRPGDTAIALAQKCWSAQCAAYEIEEHLNPRRAPFGSKQRTQNFCRGGSDKVKRAATQFLKSIDKLTTHYGWHTDASRAEREKRTTSNFWGRNFNGAWDAVQKPQAAPVDLKLLRALKKSANALWQAVLNDLPRRLGPQSQKEYAKAMQPDTGLRVLAALIAHPDSSDEEIAKAAGLSRVHLYRIRFRFGYDEGMYSIKFKELRAKTKAMAKAAAKERAPRGIRNDDKQTGNREFDGIVEDVSLDNDDESTDE